MLRVACRERTHDGCMIFRPLTTLQRETCVPAEQYGFADALRKEVVFTLRHDSHQPCERLPWPARGGASIDVGATGERRERTERDAHERRLAAAVRSDHSVEVTWPYREGHARQRIARRAGIAITNGVQSKQRFGHVVHAIVQRRGSSGKAGKPIKAVTTPTGSSRGATTVRAMVSAIASSAPPPTKAAGSRAR